MSFEKTRQCMGDASAALRRLKQAMASEDYEIDTHLLSRVTDAASSIERHRRFLARIQDPMAAPREGAEDDRLKMKIEELDLSTRTFNHLRWATGMRDRIMTLGDLTQYSPADLMNIRNFGPKSLREVRRKLRGLGLSLKDDRADPDSRHEEPDDLMAKLLATISSPDGKDDP